MKKIVLTFSYLRKKGKQKKSKTQKKNFKKYLVIIILKRYKRPVCCKKFEKNLNHIDFF